MAQIGGLYSPANSAQGEHSSQAIRKGEHAEVNQAETVNSATNVSSNHVSGVDNHVERVSVRGNQNAADADGKKEVKKRKIASDNEQSVNDQGDQREQLTALFPVFRKTGESKEVCDAKDNADDKCKNDKSDRARAQSIKKKRRLGQKQLKKCSQGQNQT